MKWTELIDRVADRADMSTRDTRRVLTALSAEAVALLSDGEEVPLRGLCTIGSRWRDARTLRSVNGRRRIHIDGRFVVRYRTSGRVRKALAARTPQLWRDPDHQRAWRAAEALVGDLALYHARDAPTDIASDLPFDKVHERCAAAFGPLWQQVSESYAARVPDEVRQTRDYLAVAARQQWGDEDGASSSSWEDEKKQAQGK